MNIRLYDMNIRMSKCKHDKKDRNICIIEKYENRNMKLQI